MDRDEFRTELHRMAQVNGLPYLNQDRLLAVMSQDIAAGADFVNICRGSDKPDVLLLTSLRTLAVRAGVFSTKVRWAVAHQELLRVDATRRIRGTYVIDAVQLQTAQELREFRFGLTRRDDFVGLDMAEENANVAAEEIADAAMPTSGPSATAGNAGLSFDPRGPEQAGEAAQVAYRETRFAEAFELYVKAIDRLHDFYCYEQFKNREPGPKDAWLVEGLVSSLGAARARDATVDVRAGVREATHRLRTIASAVAAAGGVSTLYRRGLDGLAEYAPDIDVSDIFWN